MSDISQGQIIRSGDALERAVERMSEADTLCIDTEFMRERTYYPELCLVQVADGRHAWCLDTLAIDDLTPFLSLCASSDITKVLHSARQDLEIFFALTDSVPAPVFDTQLAATLTGRGEQISYAALVEEMLGIVVDKSQTRTDWSRRPLSTAQIDYALKDVLYLSKLKEKLDAELHSSGRVSWFEEDAKLLAQESIYRVEPEQAWQKVKGVGNLPLAVFRRAALLAAWRERIAQVKNLPRSWVLKDNALIAIAERPERSMQEHQQQGVLTAKQVRHWGEEIESVVNASSAHISPPAFLGAGGLDARQKKLFKSISQLVKSIANDLALSPSILANRKEMEKVARGGTDAAMFHGWRAEIVGAPVQALLAEVGS